MKKRSKIIGSEGLSGGVSFAPSLAIVLLLPLLLCACDPRTELFGRPLGGQGAVDGRGIGRRVGLGGLWPFVATVAGAAPLLGWLGTVGGIIATFTTITLFGSGDVKILSGGISEALITTKYGLIVAIPALLAHAYLSRRAKAEVSTIRSARSFNPIVLRAIETAVSKEPPRTKDVQTCFQVDE